MGSSSRSARGLSSLLLLSLLGVLHLSDAVPVSQQNPSFVSQLPGCPNYEVEQHKPMKRVTLDDALTFLVRPNHASLALEITLSTDQLYQATVEGTMIKLEQCNTDGTNCNTLNRGGTKSSDLLDVNQWNLVNVTLEDDVITVSVNQKQDVMGRLMTVQQDVKQQKQKQSSDIQVSIRPITSIEGYSVDVTAVCNETYTPIMETMPIDLSQVTVKPRAQDPFPDCPVYDVQHDQPLEGLKVEDTLLLAVYPSEPSLQLNISLKEEMYQATIDGSMTEIYKCSMDKTHCEMMEQGGTKSSDTLVANQWNYVNITIVENKVTVKVNTRANVMRRKIVANHVVKEATVVVVATNGVPSSSSSSSGGDDDDDNDTDYSVRVNVLCDEDADGSSTTVATITTINSHDRAAPIGGITTTEQPGDSSSGSGNSTTWKVVVIILAICCVLFIAGIAYHCIKKRQGGTSFNGATELKEEPDAIQQQQQ